LSELGKTKTFKQGHFNTPWLIYKSIPSCFLFSSRAAAGSGVTGWFIGFGKKGVFFSIF